MRIRAGDLMSTAVDGQLVVLDLRSAAYLRLNRSGRRLWELLEQGCTLGDLVAAVRASYGIGQERAEADVSAFLAMLRARDLLEEPGGDAARADGADVAGEPAKSEEFGVVTGADSE